MKPIILAALIVLFSSSVFAQSRVTDILIEQSNVAARAALQRAEIWNRVIADLTVAPLVLFPPRPVYVPPPVVAPVAPVLTPSTAQQKYLEEALAYQRAQAFIPVRDARQQYFEVLDYVQTEYNAGRVPSGMDIRMVSDCGIKPLKPLPPLGCHDLVANCVLDAQGHWYWQWVCVR